MGLIKYLQKKKEQKAEEKRQKEKQIADAEQVTLEHRIFLLEQAKEQWKDRAGGNNIVISEIVDNMQEESEKSYKFILRSKKEKDIIRMFKRAETAGEFNKLLDDIKAESSSLAEEFLIAQQERLAEKKEERKRAAQARKSAAQAKLREMAVEVWGNDIERERYETEFLNWLTNKLFGLLCHLAIEKTNINLNFMPPDFIRYLRLQLFSVWNVEFQMLKDEFESEAKVTYPDMGDLALDYAYLMIMEKKVDFFLDFECTNENNFIGYSIILIKIIDLNVDSLRLLACPDRQENTVLDKIPLYKFVMLGDVKADIPVQLDGIIKYILESPYNDIPTRLKAQVQRNISEIRSNLCPITDSQQHSAMTKALTTLQKQDIIDAQVLDKVTHLFNDISPLEYINYTVKMKRDEPSHAEIIKLFFAKTYLESFFFASVPSRGMERIKKRLEAGHWHCCPN